MGNKYKYYHEISGFLNILFLCGELKMDKFLCLKTFSKIIKEKTTFSS